MDHSYFNDVNDICHCHNQLDEPTVYQADIDWIPVIRLWTDNDAWIVIFCPIMMLAINHKFYPGSHYWNYHSDDLSFN